ncbi:uncharacterized protein A1O5_06982 [Cladophialophora psammophila CBS 110553]|uniref:Uncharacterized protein n=1 Tax=Cladophialophora psammophila CBS 110553 TaxID=1182543 RepID=W9XHT3_9EURO|nr:uncharacterized protein A1O5_06982 [Cladophialophora psammophila CBS 110553]EXJ69909.1 hypothetical protein A1O5_06982 [Cladophialophora psammophila CBS 110553]
MTVEVVLRAFAGAAMFISQPEKIVETSSKAHWVVIFSNFARNVRSSSARKAKPKFSGLARQFQRSSGKWEHPTPEAQAASEGEILEYRRLHLWEFERHMEAAFLAALNFNARRWVADPDQEFSMIYPKIGQSFDKESMIPADSQTDYRKLPTDNKVALALCPAVYKTWDFSPGDRRHTCILKALVMAALVGMRQGSGISRSRICLEYAQRRTEGRLTGF